MASRAPWIVLALLACGAASGESSSPENLVPADPLVHVRLDTPRAVDSLLLALFGQGASIGAYLQLAGIPELAGLDPDAPWHVFLTAGREHWSFSALVPLVDRGAFEGSFPAGSTHLEFDIEGSHALVGRRPLPRTGGKLPRGRPAPGLQISARPGGILEAFRESIEAMLQTQLSERMRVEAESAGETYKPPFDWAGIRASAVAEHQALLALLDQCERLFFELRPVLPNVQFEARFLFETGSELAGWADAQTPKDPSRILELDGRLPLQLWSNVRLSESETLAALAARAFAGGASVQDPSSHITDAERIVASGLAPFRYEMEMVEWPADLTMEEYRSRLSDRLAAPLPPSPPPLSIERRYERDVSSLGTMPIDRLTVEAREAASRETLSHFEAFYGYDSKEVLFATGLERLSSLSRRQPKGKGWLDDLRASLPQDLVFLTWLDASAWDRWALADVPLEDRPPEIPGAGKSPAYVVHAATYTRTIEIAGWLELMQMAAIGGRARLIRSLAERYEREGSRAEKGLPEGNGFETAVGWYRRAAQLGHAEAQEDLGRMYGFGRGVQQSWEEARSWYWKAAIQGHASSQNRLGDVYYRKLGPDVDYKKALYWFKAAALQGNRYGQYNLALMYERGDGVEKSHDEAFKWYLLAAEQDHLESQTAAGHYYKRGSGVEKDLQQAEKWYLRAAEGGYAEAMVSLGGFYLYERKAEGDEKRAVEWFQRGADKGDADSLMELAASYQYGVGVEQSDSRALELYQRVIDKGGEIASAAKTAMGVIYVKQGPEVENLAAGVRYLQEAADAGNRVAQFELSILYANGRGIPRDTAQAAMWMRKSAEQELARGARGWGYYLMAGIGTERDFVEGVKWLEKAAKAGDGEGQILLGEAYERAMGVERNWTEAARWYREAARKGFATAQVRLGGQYLAGNGVPQDKAEAYAWLTLASESREEQSAALAKGLLEPLVESMTGDELARGKKLLQERR